MSETVTVRVADVRGILHAYNNLAAALLAKAETALASPDATVREDALRRMAEIAEQLGAHTRDARRRLLNRDVAG